MNVSDTELQAMLKQMDSDNSGTIEFDEFKAVLVEKLGGGGAGSVHKYFSSINTSRTGGLTPAEIRTFVRDVLKENISDIEVDMMVREANTSNSGTVSLEELQKILGVQ
eukprot:c6371_g1_i1.p3 GENE.c6371_g1_i1~~c6371_g1_i1.p3  ORF type:complete len:109 (+),score=44.60 c6371_g1_i1:446-772(+)